MPASQSVDIAIVGAGAAGVMVAVQIARQAQDSCVPMPSVLLIDGAAQPGRGAAYSTTRPEHLLNVAAARMSIFQEQPDHFVDWLRERGEPTDGLADRYIARCVYAQYLHAQWQRAQAAGVKFHCEQVVALEAEPTRRLVCASGDHVEANSVVLAVGNSARSLPLAHDGIEVIEAWDGNAISQIRADEDIVIVGAGLSMVDAVLTLAANNHRGHITVISRHGLLPLAHDVDHDHADIDVDAFAEMPLRARLRCMREWSVDNPSRNWQSMLRTLRDPGQRLWQTLDDSDQRRFLRHVVRYWDIHRHRIAPQVAATMAQMQRSGQLKIRAGRPLALRIIDDEIELTFVPRHDFAARSMIVDRVINATGLNNQLDTSANPLLQSLLATGCARPGPHGRGLDTAADGSVLDRSGNSQSNLFTLGSPRAGNLWESVAIPDIRIQARDLAERLVHATSL